MHPVASRPTRSLRIVAALFPLVAFAATAHADIFQWEYINPADPNQGKRPSATLAPDGAGVDAVPGALLAGRNLTKAYLIGADLSGAYFSNLLPQFAPDANLMSADLSGANLSGVGFRRTNLTNAILREANLANADFGLQPCCGAGGQDIFTYPSAAILVGADLAAADARGAYGLYFDGATTTNLIEPNGLVSGLALQAGQLVTVRDYDGNPVAYPAPTSQIPITVDQHLTMGAGGALRMVLETDLWDSTISFSPGIPVTLGGTLELTFAADVNLAAQVGRTFDLFDWTGVTPTGAFDIATPYRWDLSNLYTTGEVTLSAVPEPASLLPLLIGVLLILAPRRAHFALAVVVLVVCISPAFADLPMTGTYVPELHAVDAMLQNFMAGKPIPGGTITITQNDKVIYERGIGYSNAANTEPMQETALMRLASVSKPITASAIHQLAKDGQIDLNAKVFSINGNGGILDITPYNGTLGDSRLRDITVQHLLEHQGGWNRDTAGDLAFRDVQIANAMGVPSPPGILNSARYILGRPLQFSPGTDYNYSNIGYMFLGMVVEDVSGQPYETYVDNNVLTPAGIPAWEVDAGRTFAADQNPREPFYSTQFTSAQNVFDPTGPRVSWPYGGWDHEKFIALGGLIASSKAIALLAQNRILDGPEIGKLRSDYTTSPEYGWWKGGSLEGTDTLVAQGTWHDTTYSILFDRRPEDLSSYSLSLALLLESTLEGISLWPAELVYAGDFTSDQWLTLDDVSLFKQALALGSEAAFTMAHPTARYAAGDFDGDGLVNGTDAAGLIGALQHAGVPAEYVAEVLESPGDFDLDSDVDGADFLTWQRHPNIGNLADWQANFGTASTVAMNVAVPEPGTMCLAPFALAAILVTRGSRRLRIRSVSQVAACIFSSAVLASGTRADIFQWEYINPADPSQGKRQSTTLAPDGAGVDAVPGAQLGGRNLTMAYLIGADLTGANFRHANLSGAQFDDADIRGATFGRDSILPGGITLGQLYSTASYRDRDLSGITFFSNPLVSADFTEQKLSDAVFGGGNLSAALFRGANLTNARFMGSILTNADLSHANLTNAEFSYVTMTGANLTGADVRGAMVYPEPSDFAGRNLIQIDGHIQGLALVASDVLSVRDYDGDSTLGAARLPIAITVDQHFVMGPGGTLRMVFEADAWDSTISFAPGIPVTLGGTLELAFAADVNPATQLGRTFDLFDWTGVTPIGSFAISSPYRWNLSNLYATGEVTLTAVPEPASLALATMLTLLIHARNSSRR